MKPWIAVDLDGTLAYYDKWRGDSHIGAPIPEMVARVRAWRAEGKDVRIFTARVCSTQGLAIQPRDVGMIRIFIEQWCLMHVEEVLPVTHEKDFGMVELWDDRCVRVQRNTGLPCCTQFEHYP